ncbi:hypothetical protein Tco_0344254 [Tanacetum coccineum]
MDNPNITMEEYIRLKEENARRHGKVYNWETATYGKIWYDDDIHDLRSVETEFPAIVFNDELTSEKALSCEPTVSSLNNNKINFRISFDESDDEDSTVIFDKNSFSYKIIAVNDLKTDSENDNDKVNMPLFLSPEPTSDKDNDDNEIDIIQSLEGDVINIDVQGYSMCRLASRSTLSSFIRMEFNQGRCEGQDHTYQSWLIEEDTTKTMAEPILKKYMKNAQAESNPTKPNTDEDINIEISKDFLMELKNNAYQ